MSAGAWPPHKHCFSPVGGSKVQAARLAFGAVGYLQRRVRVAGGCHPKAHRTVGVGSGNDGTIWGVGNLVYGAALARDGHGASRSARRAVVPQQPGLLVEAIAPLGLGEFDNWVVLRQVASQLEGEVWVSCQYMCIRLGGDGEGGESATPSVG